MASDGNVRESCPHRTGVDNYSNLSELMFCCVRPLQLGDLRTVFQTKLSIFLGVYTVIGFAVGLIILVKNLDEYTSFTDVLGPASLAGALWPVTVFVKILEDF